MIDPGLTGKCAIVTGANHGIGAAKAQALGLLGAPADVIVFFASEQARWLTGQSLYVGGGWRISQ